jgi:hypothetical protein
MCWFQKGGIASETSSTQKTAQKVALVDLSPLAYDLNGHDITPVHVGVFYV